MGRLRVLTKLSLRDLPPGVVPLAQTEHGVLVADEEDSEAGAEAIELAPGDSFTPLPELRPRVASHVHVAGPSGCGKTTWCGRYADAFRRYLGGSVVVISHDTSEDDAITADVRLPVGPELADIALEDLAGEKPLLLVFDDTEGGGKKCEEALAVFRRSALERGRKLNIHSVNVSHRAAGGRETKSVLSEMTAMVVFPWVPASRNLRYALSEHLGVPAEIMELLKRDKDAWGRAVQINMNSPCSIIGERRATLLDTAAIEVAHKHLKKQTAREIGGMSCGDVTQAIAESRRRR